jgi:putative peptidoglycan lipid II flippase
VLPPHYLAAGVALGQSFASIVQVIVATWLLQRRLGGLRIGSWMLSLGRFVLAALPAAGAGWLTFLLLGGVSGWTVSDKLLGAIGTAIIGIVVLAVYVGFLALLRAPELSPALAMARRMLPGRSGA